jgi:superfamily II DNA or RNA helicase
MSEYSYHSSKLDYLVLNFDQLEQSKQSQQGGADYSMDEDVQNDINLLLKLEGKEELQKMEGSLLPYQIPHSEQLINILNNNGTALDASEPGIGKTYIASYVAKSLGMKVIVLCPKSVISKWKEVLTKFNVDGIMVVNYELAGRAKQYSGGQKVKSPYLKINKKKNRTSYEWTVDKNTLFIFDEVHRCKHPTTKNAKMLLAAKKTGYKILMLSATIVEKPIQFAIFAYILGLSNSLKILIEWIKKLSAPAKTLHTFLYSTSNPRAARLTISELKEAFPDTQITAETYNMKNSNKIKEEYEKMVQKIDQMKESGEKNQFIMAKLQSEFRSIEMLKVPTFIEMAEDYLENNFSVVIFVNYTATLELLAQKLKTESVIRGGQKSRERDQVIKNFQNDKTRIVICNIKAGGVGISLHDVNGKHPRVSIISPTYSSTNLVQALGRIHRSGGKTKSLQRIIFAADTPEEKIAAALGSKLSNLSLLNDGDMESYYIDGLSKKAKYEDLDQRVRQDLSQSIDERLDRIKRKKQKKQSKISELFPEMINTVSGIYNLFVLKGADFLRDVEVLIMGEHHYRNEKCRRCPKDCLEITDILTYVTHNVYPKMTDFYIELPYRHNIEDKFQDTRDSSGPSRLMRFYEEYRYLLDSKNPITENLRMHSVDIRDTKEETDESNLFYITTFFYFEADRLFRYFYDLYKEVRRDIQYSQYRERYDNIGAIFADMKAILNSPGSREAIEELATGGDKISRSFKILRQRERMRESYRDSSADNEDIDTLIDNIDKYFQREYRKLYQKSLDAFDAYRDILRYFDETVSVEKAMNDLYVNHFDKCMNYMNNGDVHVTIPLFSLYMDRYAIFRMLRRFDNKQQECIIFYGGYEHSKNISKCMLATGFFTSHATSSNYQESGHADCQRIITT